MPSLSDRVDQVLEAAISARRVVGAIALVAQRGQVVYHRAIGLADREANRPMAETTPHRFASLTKQITAVATLALAERGVLDLDQPVTRWLPDFKPRFGDGSPPITLHQLLTHTSGLGYTFSELPGGPYHETRVSDGLDQPGLSMAENLRRLASVPLRFAPGSDFAYSLGLDVIGAVLERAGDAPLGDVIARHVTDPLEITGFVFTPDHATATALAVPYHDGSPPPQIHDGTVVPLFPPIEITFAPSRALDPASYPSGGAGLVGTAAPYLRFLEALRTHRIPTVKHYDRMFTDQIPGIVPTTLNPGTGFSYAGAYMREPHPSFTALRPGGVRWGGVYGHSWAIDPTTETTHVLLTNTAFEGMIGPLSSEIEAAVHA